MQRRVNVSIFAVGVFLAVLALALTFYVAPTLAKAPLDQASVTDSAGEVTYFSVSELGETTAPVESLRTVRGDVAAGTGDIAVWDMFLATMNADTGEVLSTVEERIALDRTTGASVACCGEEPVHGDALTLKFPFGTQRADYVLWDSTAGAGFPVTYQEDAEVDGLGVFRFTQDIGPMDVGTRDVPASVVGRSGTGNVTTNERYQVSKTLWVEPATGRIVNGSQDVDQWLELDGQRVLTLSKGTVGYTDEEIADSVAEAKSDVRLLRLASRWLPLGAGILGLGLIGLGIFRGLRREEERIIVLEDATQPQPRQPTKA